MTSYKTEVLDEFGELLISQAFDLTCWYLERVLGGRIKNQSALALSALYARLDDNAQLVVRKFAFDAAFHMLADVLYLCEQHEIGLEFMTKSGERVNVVKLSDGLVGELLTDEGWVARFTKYKEGLRWPPTVPNPELVINEGDIVVGLDDSEGDEESEDDDSEAS